MNKRPHASTYGALPQPPSHPQSQPQIAGPMQPAGQQPAPDYSAAWAAYYQQQAQAQAAATRPPAPAPVPQYPQQPPMQVPSAYGYAQPPQPPPQPQPYANPYGMPQQQQPQYALPPQQQQPRPPQQQPVYPPQQQQPQPYPQQVVGYSQGGPVLYNPNPPAQPGQQPPYQAGGGQQPTSFPSRPLGPPSNLPSRGIPALPSHLPRTPTAASAAALMSTPMGHQSPSGSSGFPPAKRPRFDHQGPPEPDYPSSSYSSSRPSGLPVNPAGVNSMPLGAGGGYGPRNGGGGGSLGEYFGGGVALMSGDGRDGLGMSMSRGRGAASSSLQSSRSLGGRGYEDQSTSSGYGGAGLGRSGSGASLGGGRGGRGGSRNSPPPGLGAQALGRGGLGMGGRGDRGGYRGRGGRGAFQANLSTADAPRGPRAAPGGRAANAASSASNTPASQAAAAAEKARLKEKEDSKRTLTDFKIIGLELPELLWRWGSVPEKEREEEGKKRKADGTGSDAGDDFPDSPSASHATKHPKSYFMTHGKENAETHTTTTREISRLRIYFDSPAGHGPGEKRGRGGIEGLREKPAPAYVAPPQAPEPRVVEVTEEEQLAAVEASSKPEENGDPAAEEDDDEDLDGAPMEESEVGLLLEDVEQQIDEDAEKLRFEEEETQNALEEATIVEDQTSVGSDPALADSSNTAVDATQTEQPFESGEAPSTLIAADATAAEDVPEDDTAGDISMTSARSSVEPVSVEDAPAVSIAAPEGLLPLEITSADQEVSSALPSSLEPITSAAFIPSTTIRSSSPAPPVIQSTSVTPTTIKPAIPVPPPNMSSSNKTIVSKAKNLPTGPQNPEIKEKNYPVYDGPEPSANRVSILYERCTRRICIDAEVVERVRVSRAEGKVEFTIRWRREIEPEAEVAVTAKVKDIAEEKKEIAVEETVVKEAATEETKEVVEEGPRASSPMKESTPAPEKAGAKAEAAVVKIEEADEEKPAGEEEATIATKKEATLTPPPASATTNGSTATASKEGPKLAAGEKKVDKRRWDICRGILMELLDEETETFRPVDFEALEDMWDGVEDPTAGWTPPIHQLITPDSDQKADYPELRCDTFKIIAYLDQEKPLSEPKWIKTGNVEDWLNDIFGAPGKRAGGKGLAWRGKFEILDPEQSIHTPTIQTTLDSWAMNSTAGTARERRRFVKTHLVDMDHIFEILLRLVRGDRVAQTSAATLSSVSGPLAAAANEAGAYGKNQNHVSLSVLALLRLTNEMAEKAGVKKGVVDERVSEIIRSLPQHLVFKSVDGLFREWVPERKH